MRSLAAVFILTLFPAVECFAQLEFAACALHDGQWRFVLKETGTPRSSGWLALGDTYGAHTLDEFDPENLVLTVKNGDSVTRLPLKEPKAGKLVSRPPRDPRVGVVPNEIPIRVRDGTFSGTLKDPKAIAQLIEIFRGAFPVRGGGTSVRTRHTHILRLPEVWYYDAATGEIGFFPTRRGEMPARYLLRGDLRLVFNALLAGAPADPPPDDAPQS